MRRSVVLFALAVCAFGVPALAFDKPPYPRIGAYWLGNAAYDRADVQRDLAHTNLAFIGFWPGWGGGVSAQERAVRGIKALNPNTLIIQYVSLNEVPATSSAFAEVYEKLKTQNWLLYPVGGSGEPVTSAWGGGTYETNWTLFAPADAAGDNWLSWYAKWIMRTYGNPIPSLDGFYFDNFFVRPRVNGDWNRDGITDVFNQPVVGQWVRQGARRGVEVARQLAPARFMTGNLAEWGGQDSPAEDYAGLLNGGLIEAIMGQGNSPEAWGGWGAMMAWYRRTMSLVAEPKLVGFHAIGRPDDYQFVRYALASCLMDDGYFVFSSSAAYIDAPYFDEYDAQLGWANSGPVMNSWQNGVYRRDFQNGIVLVNPKGNGARQVFLEDDYYKVNGTQDRSVNNGQQVRSVTLQDRDGIILLRSPSGSQPAPTANPSPSPSPVTSPAPSPSPTPAAAPSPSSTPSPAAVPAPSPSSSAPKVLRKPAPPSGVLVR